MAKTKKYVRIKRAYSKGAWYANQIGSVFPSLGTWENAYKVNSPDRALYIRQEDAELIVTEKRPAKRHDRILITNADTVHGLYKNGEELVVDGQHKFGNGVFAYKEYDVHRLGCHYVTYKEYEVIVNNEEATGMKIDLDAMGCDELIEHGEAVMRAIRLRSYGEGYKQGKFDAVMDAAHSPEKEELPYEFSDEAIELAIKEAQRYLAQERRDEIVEQAKADVERLTARGLDRSQDGGFLGSYTYRAKYYVVKFNVNRNKRAVTAIVRSSDYTGKGMGDAEIGIAKAAPEDCFNEHIGKAIALHRALGLEVPDEYLNAPQPTEVRVGDVVAYRGFYKTIDYAIVVADGEPTGGGRSALTSIAVKHAKIIDDSRTEVGE